MINFNSQDKNYVEAIAEILFNDKSKIPHKDCTECGEQMSLTDRYSEFNLSMIFECPDCGHIEFITDEEFNKEKGITSLKELVV